MSFKEIVHNALRKRNIDDLINVSQHTDLRKSLGIFDLIILGIGAVVGTGIFSIIGIAIKGGAESVGAGPAICVSMVLAAIACVFSALCYSEIAAMIPVAGSAYTYTYATMGEFAAWMVGWILMLEYAIGNITVASAWCGYFTQLLKGFSHVLPSFVTNCPIWLRMDYITISHMCTKYGWDIHDKIPFIFGKIPFAVNFPAIFIVFVLTIMLLKGVKESTRLASILVGINLSMIITFIAVGSFYIKPENWQPFAPNGFEGVFMGAFLIFFAYVGFDAISTTAEEVKNPQRDLPIGILGTLIICTILYVLVALVLTGIVPLNSIDTGAPLANAMSYIHQDWFAGFISIAAIAGLTSVLLVYQLGTTRILYAMSRDHFLPKGLRLVNRKTRIPTVLTWITAWVVIIGALFMDLSISAELCNFGTFTSFIIICVAVLILRKTEPNRKRPFKVPLSPLLPILGILICSAFMIFSMHSLTTSSLLFPLWLFVGFLIYAFYGYSQKRKERFKKSTIRNVEETITEIVNR